MNIDITSIILAVISAGTTIFSAFLVYNQYTKNKNTDLKIEEWKKDKEKTESDRAEHFGKIYSELHELRVDLKASRVYIIQPHPLGNAAYITVAIEVRTPGVASMKSEMHLIPIDQVSGFVRCLSREEFFVWSDVDENDVFSDDRTKSLLQNNGTRQIFVKKLFDDEYKWKGNLVIDYTTPPFVDYDLIREKLCHSAINIQYDLPEFKED